LGGAGPCPGYWVGGGEPVKMVGKREGVQIGKKLSKGGNKLPRKNKITPTAPGKLIPSITDLLQSVMCKRGAGWPVTKTKTVFETNYLDQDSSGKKGT